MKLALLALGKVTIKAPRHREPWFPISAWEPPARETPLRSRKRNFARKCVPKQSLGTRQEVASGHEAEKVWLLAPHPLSWALILNGRSTFYNVLEESSKAPCHASHEEMET